MTAFLPVVGPEVCAHRLEMIFPRTAFDNVLSNPLAAAGLSTMIYLGAVEDDEAIATHQRYLRPSMAMWLNDPVLHHDFDEEREAWYQAALVSKERVAELQESWGLSFEQRYADNSRETLRDETFPLWREQGAMLSRAGLPTSSPLPRWIVARPFAELFDPELDGEELTSAIEDWIKHHMSTSGRLKALSVRQTAQAVHAIDVLLPSGEHRMLEPGAASSILKGVMEEWAPRKLVAPLVLTISEPGDKIYLAGGKRLAGVGIEIDPGKVLPDALIVDAGVDPVEFWVIEAVATDGEINEMRKSALLQWAGEQGVPAEQCRFLTAFTSRNSMPARRRLKDLAAGTQAWFLHEPNYELTWSEIENSPMPPKLAAVTPIAG